jgi:hypothetical protein
LRFDRRAPGFVIGVNDSAIDAQIASNPLSLALFEQHAGYGSGLAAREQN